MTHPKDDPLAAEDVIELRFRTSRTARFYCLWHSEGGQSITKADVQKVLEMLELMLDTFADPPIPGAEEAG